VRLRQQGLFALDRQAHGLRYGIPHDQLEGPGTVIFNGSRAALPQAVARLPDLRVVLVTASVPVLARRLAARGRETEAQIAQRLARAGSAMPADSPCHVVPNNGTPEDGVARLLGALQPDSVLR